MGSFGSVIPVTGLNVGFLGQVSRTGGGDPFIVAKFANSLNANNISFGDALMLLPDATGGTYRQAADWISNGGGFAFTAGTASNTTVTPGSMNGLAVGMFIFGSGITAGSFITAVGSTTITISKAATATASGVAMTAAWFGGIAVRETKTQLTYPITPGTSLVGVYTPGQMCEALVRGSITAKINVGTPQAGLPVYMRFIANGGITAGIVGGLEAAADGTNNFLIPNCEFKTGVLDANNVSEITFLNRVTV